MRQKNSSIVFIAELIVNCNLHIRWDAAEDLEESAIKVSVASWTKNN